MHSDGLKRFIITRKISVRFEHMICSTLCDSASWWYDENHWSKSL